MPNLIPAFSRLTIFSGYFLQILNIWYRKHKHYYAISIEWVFLCSDNLWNIKQLLPVMSRSISPISSIWPLMGIPWKSFVLIVVFVLVCSKTMSNSSPICISLFTEHCVPVVKPLKHYAIITCDVSIHFSNQFNTSSNGHSLEIFCSDCSVCLCLF